MCYPFEDGAGARAPVEHRLTAFVVGSTGLQREIATRVKSSGTDFSDGTKLDVVSGVIECVLFGLIAGFRRIILVPRAIATRCLKAKRFFDMRAKAAVGPVTDGFRVGRRVSEARA